MAISLCVHGVTSVAVTLLLFLLLLLSHSAHSAVVMLNFTDILPEISDHPLVDCCRSYGVSDDCLFLCDPHASDMDMIYNNDQCQYKYYHIENACETGTEPFRNDTPNEPPCLVKEILQYISGGDVNTTHGCMSSAFTRSSAAVITMCNHAWMMALMTSLYFMFWSFPRYWW